MKTIIKISDQFLVMVDTEAHELGAHLLSVYPTLSISWRVVSDDEFSKQLASTAAGTVMMYVGSYTDSDHAREVVTDSLQQLFGITTKNMLLN